MKILVTCPPMLRMIDSFRPLFAQHGAEITTPDVVQTLSVDELKQLVPLHDGWIIGDDPATREVFTAGQAGRLRAAVKWGIGVDNVDFAACKDLGIPIVNTPNMFGGEVADIAVGYVVALARQTFEIDRGVRAGQWPKPRGISLAGKTVALVGFGDIGKNTARRLLAADMKIIAYDPYATPTPALAAVEMATWPNRVEEADYIVVNCALTPSSHHMLNADVLARAKPGVRVVNVGRARWWTKRRWLLRCRAARCSRPRWTCLKKSPCLPIHRCASIRGACSARTTRRTRRTRWCAPATSPLPG